MRTFLVFFLFAVLVSSVQAGSDREFEAHWHDGKAEMNGYRLKVSRYGEDRDGTAVLVYVTEPFSESKRVKVNDWKKNPDDTFNVLKLNLVRDFQTGIYDYNTMVSIFSRTSDFSPVKVTFSSAEWCGHVYEELRVDPTRISGHFYSYFEDESGPREIPGNDEGILEDNLFILLRGLRGDYLEPGGQKKVSVLPSAYFGRMAHKDPQWVDANIARREEAETITVEAGEFETMIYEVRVVDGREGVFYIEEDYPHRLIQWEMLPDIRAELAGSERLQYWMLNHDGNEEYLKKLGL